MTDRAIGDLRNLGPKTALWLTEVGIRTEADLRRTGAVAAYRQLKTLRGGQLSLVALYAMQAALMDIDWRELPEAFRQALADEASV